ncbi:MAG: hypothetical protein WBO66_01020 [Candidatus Moraniibacteriota bacterium]
MRHFLTINGVLFGFFLLISILPHEGSFFMRSLYSISSLSIVFFLSGWNTLTLLSAILKKTFSLLEFLTLLSVLVLIIPALILVIEYQNFHLLFPTLPIINSFFLFLTGIAFLKWNKVTSLPFDVPEKIEQKLTLKLIGAGTILYTAVMGSMVTAYYPLPDLDPYYWLSQARDYFTQGRIPTFSESRPFFISFTYLFGIAAHIDLYAFFKYLLPLLSALLVFPTALIASNFRHPLQKAVVFLFPFTSGIIIIFLAESIPQALASILAFFIVALAIHSKFSSNRFFFFFTGVTILLGYFFHEALIIPLIAWLISASFSFRTTLFHLARRHSLTIILIAIIVLPYFTHIGQYAFNITNTLARNFSNIHPNFLFPQEYINVDGNAMGWGDLLGVAKYYLFYVGPALFLLFSVIPFIKKSVWSRYFLSPEGRFLSLTFFLFFLIAEIFPRAIGMAFLPDRAWIFGGVFALTFFPLLFETHIGKNRYLLILFLIGFSLNIGGALYINNLKKYIITNEQLASAEWIKSKLPGNRVIFTIESGRLLSFFSNSSVIQVRDPNFLFDETSFEKEFQVRANPFSEADQKKALELLKIAVESFDTENAMANIHDTRAILNQLELIEQAKSANEKMLQEKRPHYIYYAAPSEKNPYIDRPYMKKVKNNEDQFIFSRFPDRFTKIFSDEKNHIYIWKIL